MKKLKGQIEQSSGNVFADLGLVDPEAPLARAELARRIGELIGERQLTQTEAAQFLGIDQPKISALLRGRLGGFSFERLMRFLFILGRDVQIVVKAKPGKRRHGEVVVV